jgi:hypothetical protein
MPDPINTTIIEQAQLAVLEAEKSQLITEDNTAQTKAFADGGLKVQYTDTINDFLKIRLPMVDFAFRNKAKPMYFKKANAEFFLPATTITSSAKTMDAIGLDTAFKTQEAEFSHGSHALKDSVSRDQLWERWSQLKLQGISYATDGAPVSPVNQMTRNILNQILRDLSKNYIWNGIPASGFGTTGLKYQHGKFNTTTTINGLVGAQNTPVYSGSPTADNSYEKTYWSNDAAGQDAWANDIIARTDLMTIYADHFVLLVPKGAGLKAKNILIKYLQQTTKISLVYNVNAGALPTTEGAYLSAYGLYGRFFVNEKLDVIECEGMVTGECMLYPDVVNGEYSVDNYERVPAGMQPQGMKFSVSCDDKALQSYAGLDNLDETLFIPLYTTSNYHALYVQLEWAGQIIYKAAPLATLYNQALFLTVSALDVTPDTNVTYAKVDLTS